MILYNWKVPFIGAGNLILEIPNSNSYVSFHEELNETALVLWDNLECPIHIPLGRNQYRIEYEKLPTSEVIILSGDRREDVQYSAHDSIESCYALFQTLGG